MKPLLLLLVIHVLILHQYQKDKKESLAPRKSKPTKENFLSQELEVERRSAFKAPDSSLFSYQLVYKPLFTDPVLTASILVP